MKNLFIILTLLLVSVCETVAQSLKSAAHGVNVILKDIPKEQIIDEIQFSDGKDDTVAVVRIDYVGPPLGPLIISSKLPVMTDSLGIRAVRFPADTMAKFIQTIHLAGPKMYDRREDKILIRIVYRYHQKTYLYYETNPTLVTAYFILLEKRFVTNGDKKALITFYDFLAEMGLLRKGKNGRPLWTVINRER